MPYGRFRPVANADVCSAVPSALRPRKALISPAALSATKKSPFGAVRIFRADWNPPDAYRSTLKPGSACGQAAAGRGIIWARLVEDGVASGAGRSAAVIFRVTPGLIERWSENAAVPTSTRAASILPCWACTAHAIARPSNPTTTIRRTFLIGISLRHGDPTPQILSRGILC